MAHAARAVSAGLASLLAVAAAGAQAASDLQVLSVLRGDGPTPCAPGAEAALVTVLLRNAGTEPVPLPFEVLVFEDEDADGTYTAGVDEPWGLEVVGGPLSPGETLELAIACSGVPGFRSAPLHAFADAGNAIEEVDEQDNLRSTAQACAAPAAIALRTEWEWTVEPVIAQPLAADVDADGQVEVVVLDQSGVVYVLDGASGAHEWDTAEIGTAFNGSGQLALGDLDGDPGLEIVGRRGGRSAPLVAVDDDGTLLWISDDLGEPAGGGAPTLADLDCDGVVEVVHQGEVFDSRDGGRLFGPPAGGTTGLNAGFPSVSLALDLDGDGELEVVAGPTAYRAPATGGVAQVVWSTPAAGDGAAAAGDVDGDGLPEVAIVGKARLSLLEGESGALVWAVGLARSGDGCPADAIGGAPTIADFDGDGEPEIGVTSAHRYSVFEGDGTPLWELPLQECSGATGAAVLDLDLDGVPEVVHQDETALRVVRGTDGSVVARMPGDSGTWMEMPITADVDGDGQAEIVVVQNDFVAGATGRGVRVLGSASGAWCATRPIWNEHAYHVENVGDAGRIPAPAGTPCEAPSWERADVYRSQPPPAALDPAFDPTLRFEEVDESLLAACGPLRVVLRVGNSGADPAPGDWTVTLHDGRPEDGGLVLESLSLPPPSPGGWRDLEIVLDPAPRSGLLTAEVAPSPLGPGPPACQRADDRCEVPVDAPAEPTAPAAIGPALRAFGHGSPTADVVRGDFEWSGDRGLPRASGEHYHLLRATRPDRLDLLTGPEPWVETTWADETPRAAELPQVHYLRVLAASACEVEE